MRKADCPNCKTRCYRDSKGTLRDRVGGHTESRLMVVHSCQRQNNGHQFVHIWKRGTFHKHALEMDLPEESRKAIFDKEKKVWVCPICGMEGECY